MVFLNPSQAYLDKKAQGSRRMMIGPVIYYKYKPSKEERKKGIKPYWYRTAWDIYIFPFRFVEWPWNGWSFQVNLLFGWLVFFWNYDLGWNIQLR